MIRRAMAKKNSLSFLEDYFTSSLKIHLKPKTNPMHLITTITHYLLTHLVNFQASASILCDQEIIIGQRGSLPVMPSGYLNFKTVMLETMKTMQKQFLVNWLTSGRLAFMIQCVKVRRSPQMKKWQH